MTNTTNKQINSRNITIIILINFIIFIIFPEKSFAQEFSVGISPAVLAVQATQGYTVDTALEIENFSDDTVTLEVSYREFTVSDKDDSQISFLPDSAAFAALRPHLNISINDHPVERFLLAPKQKQKLGLKLAIPNDIPGRDFTFTIVFNDIQTGRNTAVDDSSVSNIQGGIGMNVLLSIGGTDRQTAMIEEFSAPVFIPHGPVPFKITVQNPGTHFINPAGSLRIYNLFGQQVGRLDLPRLHILSGKRRTYFDTDPLAGSSDLPDTNIYKDINLYKSIVWSEKILFGPYTATLQLSNTDSGKMYSRSIHFFALPYQAIFILAALIVVFIFIKKRVNHYLSS